MSTAMLVSVFSLALVAATQAPPNPGFSSSEDTNEGMGLTGVVSHVEGDGKALTIMAPASTSTEIEKIGRTSYIDKQTHLIAIRAAVDQNAPILRDGKAAKVGDIKAGDVVRTTYDPDRPIFVGIIAISREQIKKESEIAQKKLQEQNKTLHNDRPGAGDQ